MEWISRWWIEFMFGAIGALILSGFAFLWSQIKKNKKEDAAIEEGMKSLLRDRIIQSYNYYVHTKKKCPIYARDNINAMYEAYTALGGNGPIKKLVDGIMELPTECATGGEI